MHFETNKEEVYVTMLHGMLFSKLTLDHPKVTVLSGTMWTTKLRNSRPSPAAAAEEE